jgi:fatty-acyl-CoA synthase
MNFGMVLTRQTERHPDKSAILFEGKSFSYQQLNNRVNQLSHALQGVGIHKGDRVAVLLHNSNEYIEAFWATAKIGAVLVPINWRLGPKEVQYILNDSEAKLLLYGSSYSETVLKIAHETKSVEEYIIVDGADELGIHYEAFIQGKSSEEPDSDEANLDDLFILMYTSGTTGFPKGSMLTQNNILWTSVNQLVDFEMNKNDKTLVVAPMFHVGGLLIFSLPVTHIGATMVILRSFDVENVLRTFDEEKITTFFGAPTMFHDICQQDDLISKYDFSSLRLMLSGGAPLPLPILRKMIKFFPNAGFTEGYGVSETASCTSFLSSSDIFRKSGSVGKPFTHNEMRVINEKGEDVAPYEIGEIILRGPTTMKGYWNKPEETLNSFIGDWFRTGDLARVDEEGYCYIVDRKKDMIISGAENIYPKEIENVLYEHPSILEASVIGVPDEKWGESVMAVVVLKPGEQVTEAELIQYCKGNLASYKKPKSITFVQELPKNPSGKILKHVLRKQYSLESKEIRP